MHSTSIDDLGMRKLPATSAEDLLEIVIRRYARASTVLTSNRPVEDWGKRLGDAAAVTAMSTEGQDRLQRCRRFLVTIMPRRISTFAIAVEVGTALPGSSSTSITVQLPQPASREHPSTVSLEHAPSTRPTLSTACMPQRSTICGDARAKCQGCPWATAPSCQGCREAAVSGMYVIYILPAAYPVFI